MKGKKDRDTRDWVNEDEERRFKEERAMVRDKLRKAKLERTHQQTTPTDREKPRSKTRD